MSRAGQPPGGAGLQGLGLGGGAPTGLGGCLGQAGGPLLWVPSSRLHLQALRPAGWAPWRCSRCDPGWRWGTCKAGAGDGCRRHCRALCCGKWEPPCPAGRPWVGAGEGAGERRPAGLKEPLRLLQAAVGPLGCCGHQWKHSMSMPEGAKVSLTREWQTVPGGKARASWAGQGLSGDKAPSSLPQQGRVPCVPR